MLTELLSRMDARFLEKQGIQFGQNPKACLDEVHAMIDTKAPALKEFLRVANAFLGDASVVGASVVLWLIKKSEEAQEKPEEWLSGIMVLLDNDFCLSQANSLITDANEFLSQPREMIAPLLKTFRYRK